MEGLRNVRDDAGLLNLLAALGTLVLIGYGPAAENLALRESLDALLAAQPQPSAPVRRAVAEVVSAFAAAPK